MSRYSESFLWCTKLPSNWMKPQNKFLLKVEKHQRGNKKLNGGKDG